MSPSERTSFPAFNYATYAVQERARRGVVSEIAAIILIKVPFVKGG
jgi:hypothetical protein